MESGLLSENRRNVERMCQLVSDELVLQLGTPDICVKVLAVRPSDDSGELHGLYLPESDGEVARVRLWMRTAKHKKVVAFRSFIRTLLHEFCHHVDYELFRFPETFHTRGFYERESSLFHQLVSNSRAPKADSTRGEKKPGKEQLR